MTWTITTWKILSFTCYYIKSILPPILPLLKKFILGALKACGENTSHCLEQCTYGCNSRKLINIEQSLAATNKR